MIAPFFSIIGAFLPIIGLLLEFSLIICFVGYAIFLILYGIVWAIQSAYRYVIGEFKYLRE